jgi:hypothetical protein
MRPIYLNPIDKKYENDGLDPDKEYPRMPRIWKILDVMPRLPTMLM